MAPRYDTISFLTDYGYDDEFAGVVRAVMRDIAPHAGIVDLTHGVAPFDVRGGSLALARAIGYVPSGVVLAVVDPGVGTNRRAIAVEVAGGEGVIVGPDNGLLAPAVALAGGAERAVVLDNPDYHLSHDSATFDGRDVFGPVAAHLCNGVELEALGTMIDPVELMPGVIPLPRDGAEGQLLCEVLWIDRFGNVQLNLSPDDLDLAWGIERESRVRITVGDASAPTVRSVPIVRAFAEIPQGGLGIIVDSSGMYALAVDRYSAATELGIGVTDLVAVSRSDDSAPQPQPTPVTLGPRR